MSGRLWRAKAMSGPATAPPSQALHIDVPVPRGDEGREAALQRLELPAADRRAVVAVAVDEAAVEGREEPPALVERHRHRAAGRGARGLVPARIPRDRRARVVKPGRVRDDPRVAHLRPERRHHDGRAAVHQRARALPDALSRERMREHRCDPRRGLIGPVAAAGLRRSSRTADAHRRQARELRAAGARRLPAVVVVLDLVDEPVSVVGPQPFDAPGPQRQARLLHHRRHIRVRGRREHEQDHRRCGEGARTPAEATTAASGRRVGGTARVDRRTLRTACESTVKRR
jgi:hypothetical protein